MADMPELKECPFCQGKAKFVSDRGEDVVYTGVECTQCFVKTDMIEAPYSHPEAAAHLWNTRADRTHPESKVERIAAFLWQRDYPRGGSMYKTYESLPFHDKELYRKEALALLGGEQ